MSYKEMLKILKNVYIEKLNVLTSKKQIDINNVNI